MQFEKLLFRVSILPLSFILSRAQGPTIPQIKPVVFELETNQQFAGTDVHRWEVFTRARVALSPTVSVEYVNPNAGMRMEGIDPTGATLNLHQGSNPANWKRDRPGFEGVAYWELYAGIDLVYHLTGSGGLKGDFILKPGADPGQIRFRFVGAAVCVDKSGLAIHAVDGSLNEQIPAVYEVAPEGRRARSAHYRQYADGTIGFETGARDTANPLVIDPDLTFSTYLAGSLADQVTAMTYSASDSSLLVAGWTQSPDFPGLASGQFKASTDAFLAKFNVASTGAVTLGAVTLWGGSGVDKITSISKNSQGYVLLGGSTTSADFPVTKPAAIQTRLNGSMNGFLLLVGNGMTYATYLGGSKSDEITGVGIDTNNMMFFAGTTSSLDLPTVNAAQERFGGGATDGFAGVLTPVLSVGYLTYIGGSGQDSISGFALGGIAGATEVYLTGGTGSSDFPVYRALQPKLAGGQDAFLTKLSSSGQIAYSTFLGGSGTDAGSAVAVSPLGEAYVAGVTGSSNFPVSNAAQATFTSGGTDAFLFKVNADASLAFSTYLGGSGADQANAVTLLRSGSIVVGGSTASANFPVKALPFDKAPLGGTYGGSTLNGASDAFVSVLSPGGSLLWGTFLGGSGSDAATALASDLNNDIYVAGTAGSQDFPLVKTLQSKASASAAHGFVARLSTSRRAGVFRPSTGDFFLGNNFDFSSYARFSWAGVTGPDAIPVVGDWDNTGQKRLGLYRSGTWYLDMDGDSVFTPGVDKQVTFGWAGTQPVVGDWDNTGRDRLGFFQNGLWFLDLLGDRVLRYTAQTVFSMGGIGDSPVVGDWTNSGKTRLGVVRQNHWLLDLDGDHKGDTNYSFGAKTDIFLFADWDQSGVNRIGSFRTAGYPIGWWFVDINGDNAMTNPTFPCAPDRCFSMGATGDIPVVGVRGDWIGGVKGSNSPTLSVSPSSTALAARASQVFTVKATNLAGGVTWKALAGTVLADGTYTAPPYATIDTITATSVTRPDLSATATVTVSASGSPTITISGALVPSGSSFTVALRPGTSKTIPITPDNFQSAVAITASSVPSGLGVTFSGNPISAMIVTASASAVATDNYSFTLTATDGVTTYPVTASVILLRQPACSLSGVPAFGSAPPASYKDPCFGTSVSSVPTASHPQGQALDETGQLGFNQDNTLLATWDVANMDTWVYPVTNTSNGVVIGAGIAIGATLAKTSFGGGGSEFRWADAQPNTLIFTRTGLTFYSLRIIKNADGTLAVSTPILIADLTHDPHFKAPAQQQFHRCYVNYSSATQPVTSTVVLCMISDAVTYAWNAYAVVQISSLTTASTSANPNYTLIAYRQNTAPDSAVVSGVYGGAMTDITQVNTAYQNLSGLTSASDPGVNYTYYLTSPYEVHCVTSTTCTGQQGEYKMQMDRTGRYVFSSAFSVTPNRLRATTIAVFDLFNGGTTYNVPNLDITQIAPANRYFLQAMAHNDSGFGNIVGASNHFENNIPYTTTWINVAAPPGQATFGGSAAALSSNPDALANLTIPAAWTQANKVNTGYAVLDLVETQGYPIFYISNATASGNKAGVYQTCTLVGFSNNSAGDCGTNGHLYDQVFVLDLATGAPSSAAKLFHDYTMGIPYLAPIISRDGAMLAFTSNFSTPNLYVMVAKIR